MARRAVSVVHISDAAGRVLPNGTIRALEFLLSKLRPCLGEVQVLQTGGAEYLEHKRVSKGTFLVLAPDDPPPAGARSGSWWVLPGDEAGKGDHPGGDGDGASRMAAKLVEGFWRSFVWYRGRRTSKGVAAIEAVINPFLEPGEAAPPGMELVAHWTLLGGDATFPAAALAGRRQHGPDLHAGEGTASLLGEILPELVLWESDPSGSQAVSVPVCRDHALTVVPLQDGAAESPVRLAVVHRSPPLAEGALQELLARLSQAKAELRLKTSMALSVPPLPMERFETSSKTLVSSIPALLLLDPDLAGEVLRHIAIGYASYVRRTFGTRLSPKLRQQLSGAVHAEGAEPTAGGASGRTGEVSGDMRPGSPEEARQQRRFLGRMIGLSHILADPREDHGEEDGSFSLERSPLGTGAAPIPPMGSFLPKAVRPYRRLFFQMLLLDLYGTGPVLEHVLESGGLRAGLEDVVRLATGERRDRDPYPGGFSTIGKQLRDGLHEPFRIAFPPASSLASRRSPEATPSPGRDGASKVGKAGPWWVPGDQGPSAWPGLESSEGFEDVLCWWLGLSVALETGSVRYDHLFGDRFARRADVLNGAPFRGFARLWNRSREVLARRLRRHKAWNTIPPDLTTNAASGVDTPQAGPARQGAPTQDGSASPSTMHLHVDSLWLQMYMLWSLMRHISADEAVFVHFPSPRLMVTFLKRLGDLMVAALWAELAHDRHKVLFGVLVPPEGQEEPDLPPLPANPVGIDAYTDALIELVAAYAHHVIELPLEVHVRRYLRQFLDRQALLYLLKDHYRDHLYHVIDVFLFGDFLLRCRLGSEKVFVRDVLEDLLARTGEPPSRRCKKDTAQQEPQPDLLRNWCVAGLFHDLGYVFLLYGRLSREMGEEIEGGPLRRFVGGMRQALTGELETLEQAIRERFADLSARHPAEVLREDHGVLSGLIVDEHLRTIDWSSEETRLVRRFWPALMAICLHNLSHRRITVAEHPVAYLLALCDELQDWGRARVQRAALRRDVVWAIASPANWQIRSHPVLGELLVEVDGRGNGEDFVLAGPTGVTASRGEQFEAVRLDLVQIYDPVDPAVLDPLFLWIGKALAFERLDHRSAPWRPRLLLVTPVPERLQRLELDFRELLDRVVDEAPELNLERFAHCSHAARYALLGVREPAGAAPPATAGRKYLETLAWRVEKGGHGLRKSDWLILDLQQLSETQPLRGFATEGGWTRLAEVRERLLAAEERKDRPAVTGA